MWGLFVLLVAGGACAFRPDNADVPPYVQSREAFGHARLYLQENVPQEQKDFRHATSRQHLAYGIVVAVTSKISEHPGEDNPLDVMDKQVPHAWENYEEVARNVNQLLAEANSKIQPISSLIDVLCRTIDSVEKCNIEVNEKIKNSDQFIKNRAKLLIALGRASKSLARHEAELYDVTKAFRVVPFFIKNFQLQPYKQFVKELHNIYVLLRKYTHRN